MDRAGAERHRIAVLLDLHTVPNSQNGRDGGGLCGVCKWHRTPEHVNLALDVLEQLARRYRNHPNLWGIEVLNEPKQHRLGLSRRAAGRIYNVSR